MNSHNSFISRPAELVVLIYRTNIIVYSSGPSSNHTHIINYNYNPSYHQFQRVLSSGQILNNKNKQQIQQTAFKMNEALTPSKPAFFRQSLLTGQHLDPSASIQRQFCKSESKMLLKKIESNKTQIFPKQYTNKYFRNSSLYEQKQNEKLLQLNRFYGFMRKTKMVKRFKEKRLNSITQPNEQHSQNHQSSLHLLNQLKFRSIRNKNYSNLEKHPWLDSRQKTEPSVMHTDNKDRALKEISINSYENIVSLPKEKISTSRALQKYARLIKQEIFHSNKSHIFDRSPIKKERTANYHSNIEAKQLTLCSKITKNNEYQSNRDFNRTTKVRSSKVKGISQFSSGLQEQKYDINGWQTTF